MCHLPNATFRVSPAVMTNDGAAHQTCASVHGAGDLKVLCGCTLNESLDGILQPTSKIHCQASSNIAYNNPNEGLIKAIARRMRHKAKTDAR